MFAPPVNLMPVPTSPINKSKSPKIASAQLPGGAENGASSTSDNSSNPFRKSMEGNSNGNGTAQATGTGSAAAGGIKPTGQGKIQGQAQDFTIPELGIDPSNGLERTLSLFPFTAENTDEISFGGNEIIWIIEKDHEYNDGWYKGRNGKGEEGLFPASYILPEGADPAPFLEMQREMGGMGMAPGFGNVMGGEQQQQVGSNVGAVKESAPAGEELQIPAVVENGMVRRNSNSPPRSPERVKRDSLVETRDQAANGEVQGPHAKASEFTSPAEQANARIGETASGAATPKPMMEQIATEAPKMPMSTLTGLIGGEALTPIPTNETDPMHDAERDASFSRPSTDIHADGTGGGIRAMLAEQARLENERREKKREEEEMLKRLSASENDPNSNVFGKGRAGFQSGVRITGGVPAGLVYSDESDSEDEEGSVHGGLGSPGGRKDQHRRLGLEEDDDGGEGFTGFGLSRLGAAKPATVGMGITGVSAPLGSTTTSNQLQKPSFDRRGSSEVTPQPTPGVATPPLQVRGMPVSRIDIPPSANVSPGNVTSPLPDEESPRGTSAPPLPEVEQVASPGLQNVLDVDPLQDPAFAQPTAPQPMSQPMQAIFSEPVPQAGSVTPPIMSRDYSAPNPSGLPRDSRSSALGMTVPGAIAVGAMGPPAIQGLSRKQSEDLQSYSPFGGQPPQTFNQPRSQTNSRGATPREGQSVSGSAGGAPGWAGIPGHPSSWGVDEVVEWARRKGFDDAICEKFLEHEITGDVLLELDANLLKELDIPQFGKRIKIANAIAELRRPQSTVSVGNNSIRSSHGPGGSGLLHRGSLGGGAISPAMQTSQPASPGQGYDYGSRNASGTAVQAIPEDYVMSQQPSSDTPEQMNYPPSSRRQSGPQTSSRSSPALPASASTVSSTAPVGPAAAAYAEWAHSRKSSASQSLANAPIREEDESGRHQRVPSVHQSITPDAPTPSMLPAATAPAPATAPASSRDGSGSIHSANSSIPPSPQTPNTKRASADRGYLGHKKAKSSVDSSKVNNDRMSFFGGTLGRNRKPAPRYPSNASTAYGLDDPNASPGGGVEKQKSLTRLVGGNNRLSKTSAPPPASAPVQGNQRISVGNPIPATQPSSPLHASASEGTALNKIGKPDFAGYMKKKGERYNSWKQRYFVLKGAHLYYLKGPNETKVKGHIELVGYKVLSDPNSGAGYGFQIVHDREKTHYFASSDHRVIKDWMKNLMKATISRDYSAPVVSSCNIPTIPLREAQMIQPRPPSPSQRDATQRATRRENPNQLTARDASVLMSLDGSPTSPKGQKPTGVPRGPSGVPAAPGRPSRDTRRPSEGRRSISSSNAQSGPYPPMPVAMAPIVAPPARQSVTAPPAQTAADPNDGSLLFWYNSHLPPSCEKAYGIPESFTSGKLVSRIIETYCSAESASGHPAEDAIFVQQATGEPNLEGLFTMMDKCIDEGVDTVGVSINDIRQGHAAEIRRLLVSVRDWAEMRQRQPE